MLTKAQKLRAEIELIDDAIERRTSLASLLNRLRNDYIMRAVELHDGDIMATAKYLGVYPSHVYNVVNKNPQ